MDEDEQIRRLISDDLAHEADGEDASVLAAVRARQRRRRRAGVIIAVIVVVLAITALATLYLLAAQVLPPLREVSAAAFLWAPVAVVAALIIVASGISVSAALSMRR